jgi:hypothetical protein
MSPAKDRLLNCALYEAEGDGEAHLTNSPLRRLNRAALTLVRSHRIARRLVELLNAAIRAQGQSRLHLPPETRVARKAGTLTSPVARPPIRAGAVCVSACR